MGILASAPLTDLTHSYSRLGKHYGSEKDKPKKTHCAAREKALAFLDVMERKTKSVIELSNQSAAEQIEKNREVLTSVVKTVLLCGKQNIALRGHRDDSQHIADQD